jgi:hypothetical protein
MDAERQRIINEAARISNEIEQMFIDYEYWNELHPDEQPIDTDPDGQLGRWKRSMDSLLANEARMGNHPSVVPLKARRRNYIPVLATEAVREHLFGKENLN